MFNRKLFIDKVNKILDATKNEGRIYLYYMDLVNFKLVNYYYGIEKGNELLHAVVEFVQEIPEVAYCARIFSDQFIFIVVEKKERADEEIIASYNHYAEAFLSTLREKYPICNLKFCCGISVMKNRNVVEAIDLANMARMDAKKAKAVTAVLFTQSRLQTLAIQQEQEKEITLALNKGRFIFYLQPKVNLLTGKIIGTEALARRLDGDGNLIYPDSFVSIMEENGSIVELDFQIFNLVCRYLHSRLKKELPVVCTSVNFSRLHIRNLETAERLHRVAQAYHIPPKLLEFELTESILLDEFDEAKAMVDKLRAFGYSVSIDDFGSGYTGINIFQEFNFDILKLDRKFLSEDASIKTRNNAIIPNIIHIARKLGIDVICEGVERADQCRALRDFGCYCAQGFYFSEPVPPDEFYKTYFQLHGQYALPL